MTWNIKSNLKVYKTSEPLEEAVSIAIRGADCFSEAIRLEREGVSILISPGSQADEVTGRYETELAIKDAAQKKRKTGTVRHNPKGSSRLEDSMATAIEKARETQGCVAVEERRASVLVNADSVPHEVQSRYDAEAEIRDRRIASSKGHWAATHNGIIYTANNALPIETIVENAIEGANLLHQSVFITYEDIPLRVNSESIASEVASDYRTQYAERNHERIESAKAVLAGLLPVIESGDRTAIVNLLGRLAHTRAFPDDFDSSGTLLAAFENAGYQGNAPSSPPRKQDPQEKWERYLINLSVDFLQERVPLPMAIAKYAERYNALFPGTVVQAGVEISSPPEQERRTGK